MKIRAAIQSDAENILILIKEVAEHASLTNKVVATIDGVKETLFCDNFKASVLILQVVNNLDCARVEWCCPGSDNLSIEFRCRNNISLDSI